MFFPFFEKFYKFYSLPSYSHYYINKLVVKEYTETREPKVEAFTPFFSSFMATENFWNHSLFRIF
jgi:hypothetical protein